MHLYTTGICSVLTQCYYYRNCQEEIKQSNSSKPFPQYLWVTTRIICDPQQVNIEKASCRWYTPVIPATQKGETEEAWLKISTGKR
jgi:hypothetical protein